MRICKLLYINYKNGFLFRPLTRKPFNTKTKLDLTKLFYSQSFTTPFLFGTKICIYYLLNKQE